MIYSNVMVRLCRHGAGCIICIYSNVIAVCLGIWYPGIRSELLYAEMDLSSSAWMGSSFLSPSELINSSFRDASKFEPSTSGIIFVLETVRGSCVQRSVAYIEAEVIIHVRIISLIKIASKSMTCSQRVSVVEQEDVD